jgi:hypothetical protein
MKSLFGSISEYFAIVDQALTSNKVNWPQTYKYFKKRKDKLKHKGVLIFGE